MIEKTVIKINVSSLIFAAIAGLQIGAAMVIAGSLKVPANALAVMAISAMGFFTLRLSFAPVIVTITQDGDAGLGSDEGRE